MSSSVTMKSILMCFVSFLCTQATTTGLKLKPEPGDGRNRHVRQFQSLAIDCYGPVNKEPLKPCWSGPEGSDFSESQEEWKAENVDHHENIFHCVLKIDKFKNDDVGTYTCTFFDEQIKITLNLQEEIQECEDGKYGVHCTEDCSEFCLPRGATESTCHGTNGTCRYGCKDGYTGPFCTCETLTVSSGLSAGAIAAIVIGSLIGTCAVMCLIMKIYVLKKQRRNSYLPSIVPLKVKNEQLETCTEEYEKLSEQMKDLKWCITQSNGDIHRELTKIYGQLPDNLAEMLKGTLNSVKTIAFFQGELEKCQVKLEEKEAEVNILKEDVAKLNQEMEKQERKEDLDTRWKYDPTQRAPPAASSSSDPTTLLETTEADEKEGGFSIRRNNEVRSSSEVRPRFVK